MSRKLVLIMTLMVFLVGMLSVAFKVKMVKASGTIYIRANGLVENTDKIVSADNVTYTFTDNINDSIVVQRSNIIIDGKGYTLQGSGIGRGFILYGINNVTVKNTNITDFGYGVDLESSNNSIVSGNTITNSTTWGVYLCLSNNSVVSGNTITNSTDGVYLESSNNIVVSGNTITNSTDNGVYLGWSNSSVVSGNTITNNYYGVYLGSSNSSVVSGNTITNSTDGVHLYSSNNGAVSGNTITNTSIGVYLWSSNSSVVSGNNITKSTNCGVYLWSSNNSTIYGNTITNSNYGVYLYGGSSNNKFYHNHFIDNIQQVYIEAPSYANFWDNGYPSGGNYWSDYRDVDKYSGPYQNETGSDGIWDHPYVIDENNRDNYPIVPEFPTWTSMLLVLIVLTIAVAIYKRRLLKTPIH
jgi:parallel beta-helix repeat protein